MPDIIVPTVLKIYENDNGKTKLLHDGIQVADMTVDTVYYFEGVDQKYKAQCIYKDGNTAIMQTYGLYGGAWPGSGNLTPATNPVTNLLGSAATNYRLPTGTSTSNISVSGASGDGATSAKLFDILKSAATSCSSFGVSGMLSWLGTESNQSNAYCVIYTNEVTAYGKSYQYVIAPAFDIDLSKIIINDATNMIGIK